VAVCVEKNVVGLYVPRCRTVGERTGMEVGPTLPVDDSVFVEVDKGG
jgi:hypothetical protein